MHHRTEKCIGFMGALTVFLLPIWAVAQPVPQPAPQADDANEVKLQVDLQAQRAEKMAPYIRAIQDAQSLSPAAKAYARGAAIDNRYAPLHDAYMKRMLTFGLPKVARYPAQVLVRLQPTNGTAWGVLGYFAGQKGDLAEALSYSARAAKLKPDDPSIMNNVGQLIAWYRQVLAMPDLHDRDKRAIDLQANVWAEHPMYVRAYDRIHIAFEQQKRLDNVFAKKLAAAEAAVLALHRHALDIQAEIDDVNKELRQHRRQLEVYRAQYYSRSLPYYYRIGRGGDDRGIYVPYYPSWPQRLQLEALMLEEQQAIDELMSREAELMREGRKVVASMREKQMQLNEVREQDTQFRERLLKHFRWDPPAVNGVVTDERVFPMAAKQDVAATLPEDPASQASRKLSLAQAYRASGMDDKARAILKDIVATWPDTPAGQSAREQLKE